jgi:hypothetical protein
MGSRNKSEQKSKPVSDSNSLLGLHADISYHLGRIADLFDRERKREVMLTIVIRTPWLEDGGVLMGNDSIDAALSEIERLRNREPIKTMARA